MDAIRERVLLEELVGMLCEEHGYDVHAAIRTLAGPSGAGHAPVDVPVASQDLAGYGIDALWRTYRGLVNTRPAQAASDAYLAAEDELLGGLIDRAGITTLDRCEPAVLDDRLRLWRGDITTIRADAIVNAANSAMLGCWAPNHLCIDNAIHTFAGVRLRLECARIMEEQGAEEPTGQAKITSAFNLPARFVIHTVGPIAAGHPTARHRLELASSYRSCLDLAQEEGLGSIVFCCISTGVFGFPQEEAARIAVDTVRGWLDATGSDMTVVFNVFLESDERIYRSILMQ